MRRFKIIDIGARGGNGSIPAFLGWGLSFFCDGYNGSGHIFYATTLDYKMPAGETSQVLRFVLPQKSVLG